MTTKYVLNENGNTSWNSATLCNIFKIHNIKTIKNTINNNNSKVSPSK